MILYVTICSVLLFSLSGLLSFLLDSRVRSQAINEVNQQGFQVMHLVSQAIRNGRSIQVPLQGTGSSTLSLTVSNVTDNPTVFFISSSTMFISEGGRQKIALTNSRVIVSDLSFQNVSSSSSLEKIIRVSFVMEHSNPSKRGEYSFSKTFNGSAILH